MSAGNFLCTSLIHLDGFRFRWFSSCTVEKGAEPADAVLDHVTTFIRVKLLDILRRTQDSLEARSDKMQIFLTRGWDISSHFCGDQSVSTASSQHEIENET